MPDPIDCFCGFPIFSVTLPPELSQACDPIVWVHSGTRDVYCYPESEEGTTERRAIATPLPPKSLISREDA